MQFKYDLPALEASLATLDGFKRIMKPFLFIFGGSRAGYDMWSKALVKKVVANYKLADFRKAEKDGENFYQICAFSAKEAATAEWLAKKRQELKSISGEVLRREAMAQSVSPHFRSFLFDDTENKIISLSAPFTGHFVFPIHTGKEMVDYPVVLSIYAGGLYRYYPIDAELIKQFKLAVAA